MSKLFISTLGTNKYQDCTYYFNINNLKENYKTKYIQEAAIRYFCKNWESNDRVAIFVTNESEKLNWNDSSSNENLGLFKVLSELKKDPLYEKISLDNALVKIPTGSSESEIWDIFSIIVSQIKDNDEIYLDITHAFRHIPMLLIVVLQYVRQVKKDITLRSITYGAYEARVADQAPVFDLTNFATLSEYTANVHDFIEYGKIKSNHKLNRFWEDLRTVANKAKGTIRKNGGLADEHKELDSHLKNVVVVVNQMEKLTSSLSSNNLSDILQYSDVNERLSAVSNFTNNSKGTEIESIFSLPIFSTLIDQVNEKIKHFKPNNDGNVFSAVNWCIEHEMYQNAFSFLIEGLVTILLKKSGGNYSSLEDRGVVSALPKYYESGIEGITGKAREREDLLVALKNVISGSYLKKFIFNFSALQNDRNAYMHCGTNSTNPAINNSNKLIENLISNANYFKKWYFATEEK